MLLGRQRRREGFKGSLGRRGGLRAAYCLTSLSETRRKSPGKRLAGSRKAPGRWPKDMLLGRQRRREGFQGSLGRKGERLRAAYCLTSLSETRRKSPTKRLAGGQRTCCWAAKDAGKGLRARFKGRPGRREAFNGSLLPNVAF